MTQCPDGFCSEVPQCARASLATCLFGTYFVDADPAIALCDARCLTSPDPACRHACLVESTPTLAACVTSSVSARSSASSVRTCFERGGPADQGRCCKNEIRCAGGLCQTVPVCSPDATSDTCRTGKLFIGADPAIATCELQCLGSPAECVHACLINRTPTIAACSPGSSSSPASRSSQGSSRSDSAASSGRSGASSGRSGASSAGPAASSAGSAARSGDAGSSRSGGTGDSRSSAVYTVVRSSTLVTVTTILPGDRVVSVGDGGGDRGWTRGGQSFTRVVHQTMPDGRVLSVVLDVLSPFCGDGVVQLDQGEECDDGNEADTDGCRNACVLPRCGDGLLSDGEQCEDGNTLSGDGCSQACLPDLPGRVQAVVIDLPISPVAGAVTGRPGVGGKTAAGTAEEDALRRTATGHAPAGETGPAAIGVMAAGAAAGWAWVRRRSAATVDRR